MIIAARVETEKEKNDDVSHPPLASSCLRHVVAAQNTKPQTAAEPRFLCQAENGFSYAAIEEGSPGNPDSPTTYCTTHR